MKWTLVFTKDAQKDSKKLLSAGLKTKTERLLDVIRNNPYQNPPPYEKLVVILPEHILGVSTFIIGSFIKYSKIAKL